MLSSLEMVSEPSGKTKTLADLIKEGAIITPETPVHTSDDSIELKEYIESMLPPVGSSPWDIINVSTDVAYETDMALPDKIQTALKKSSDDAYNDIIITLTDMSRYNIMCVSDTWKHFYNVIKNPPLYPEKYVLMNTTGSDSPSTVYLTPKGTDDSGNYLIRFHAVATAIQSNSIKYSISVR